MKWKQTAFDGMEAYEINTGPWRMAVVTQCGPRIAFLGEPEGENILYWDKDGVKRNGWRLYGGHRVWLTRPMADESEDAYVPDNEPCGVALVGEELVVTAPAHPAHRLERGMKIRCLAENRFQVVNFVRNCGDLICSGGVWSPTCINPRGKTLRVPLGEEDAAWDIVKIVIPRVFAGNVTKLEDPQVRFEGNDMVITPMGRVVKRCAQAPKGVIVMEWKEKGIFFTKRSPYLRNGSYPLGGCNLAVFVGQDNWMAEMETFGCEEAILPGAVLENEEFWELEK